MILKTLGRPLPVAHLLVAGLIFAECLHDICRTSNGIQKFCTLYYKRKICYCGCRETIFN